MINLSELKGYILGTSSLTYYVAAEFFSLLALMVSLYLHSMKREPASHNTPYKFSWKFLLWDNTKRIFIGQTLMFLFFRFAPEVFGRQLDMWLACGIGALLSFGVDKAIQWFITKNPASILTSAAARDSFLKQNP
jgi:hypothetical protein